jgi:hypothetical protein
MSKEFTLQIIWDSAISVDNGVPTMSEIETSEIDLSEIYISEIDLSEIDISEIDLSEIELNEIETSEIEISEISEQTKNCFFDTKNPKKWFKPRI